MLDCIGDKSNHEKYSMCDHDHNTKYLISYRPCHEPVIQFFHIWGMYDFLVQAVRFVWLIYAHDLILSHNFCILIEDISPH